MPAAPVPVAIRLPDGLVLRGHEWPVDGPAVVFLHDHGDDLDAWGPITAGVASHGFRVISVELRGHGLSDGDADPSLVGHDLPALLGETAASFGPVALVAYGRVTEAMLFVNEDHGAPVQVMISPLPEAPREIDWRTTRSAMRLVVKGALNEEVERQVGFIYPRMRGPKLQVSGASDAVGAATAGGSAPALRAPGDLPPPLPNRPPPRLDRRPHRPDRRGPREAPRRRGLDARRIAGRRAWWGSSTGEGLGAGRVPISQRSRRQGPRSPW